MDTIEQPRTQAEQQIPPTTRFGEAGRKIARLDGAVAAFFAIAFVLAWGVWLVMDRLAAASGLDTDTYLRAIERWDADRVPGRLPLPFLYGVTRLADFSFTIAGAVMIAATEGRAGFQRVALQLTGWQVPLCWYALAVRTDGADRDPEPRATSGPTLRGPRAWALMRTVAEVRPPYTAGDPATSLGIDKGYVSKVDPIVFNRTRTEGSYPRVSVAQTAIDLLTGTARMPSEGEQLLELMQRNLPAWQHSGLRTP